MDIPLTNPVGATLADGAATGTIVDNDATAAGIPALSEWMLVLLAAFLASAAARSLRFH